MPSSLISSMRGRSGGASQRIARIPADADDLAAEAFLREWDFETYLATYRSGEVLDVRELLDGSA